MLTSGYFLGLVCVVNVLAAFPLVGQESAKAMFGDPTDKHSEMTGAPKASAKPSVSQKSRPSSNAASSNESSSKVTKVFAPGVKYWIELQKLGRETENVVTGHEFHSGERIRLHLVSNIDGRLTIMQKEESDPFVLLFPTKPGGRNEILSRHEQMFPSERRWFRFDNNPGQLTLLLVIAPISSLEVPEQSKPVPDSSVQMAANDMANQAEIQKGSKALVEETYEGEDPAGYVVANPAKRTMPDAPIAFEITIHHKP